MHDIMNKRIARNVIKVLIHLGYLCSSSAGVASEGSSNTLSLYTAEAVEFFGLDGHFAAKTNTTRSAPDE